MYSHLPGGEIIEQGLRDLDGGVESVNSLLVIIGAERLKLHGIKIPPHYASNELPEHRLYASLSMQFGKEAYRHYNSELRLLVSLERALDALAYKQSNTVIE